MCMAGLQANQVVETVTQKVRRQIDDLERASNSDNSSALSVDGVPIDSYITRYWGYESLGNAGRVHELDTEELVWEVGLHGN